jgi:PAS domain S-box-containing protein
MEMEKKTTAELAAEVEAMRQRLAMLEECGSELERVQKQYNALLQSAPDAIIFIDRDTRIKQVNAQLEKLFGYRPGELAGRQLDILIPKQFQERHQGFVADFFKNPRKRAMGGHLEIYGVRKDGEEFPADISLSYLEIDGEFLVTAAVRDITDRKQAEEKIMRDFHIQRVISSVLKVSLEPITLDEQLQRILEQIVTIPQLVLEGKGAIYVIDPKDQSLIMKAQQGFPEEHVLPCQRVEFGECLCGKAAEDCKIIYAEYADERHNIVYNGLFPHGHYCVPILEGQETVGLINVFVREGHKRSDTEEKFLTVIADTIAGVIRHQRIEEEKKRLLKKLADSEKMVALGRLTTNFTHEIRNPLTAVGGLVRRLAKKMPQKSEEMKYVDQIVEEVGRLEILLKNMVAYSNAQMISLEKHDLRKIIKGLLAEVTESCRLQSISIETALEEIPMVHIDLELIEAMLKNLITNAIEAMPEGGRLMVSTEFRQVAVGDFVVIRVRDTGVGIADENIPLVFEPLFTTKIHISRPGLGLASSKKIVEAHGGIISMQSREGEGTEFTVTFPVEKPETVLDYSI